jgi:hypothetical protein
MQSQFVLATKTLDEAVSEDRSDARPFYGSVAAALPLPKQRRFNAYAQYYEAAGKAAAEGRYTDLPKQSQFVHAPPYGLGDIVMNPIESLVGVDPLPTWETYAGRVLETDAYGWHPCRPGYAGHHRNRTCSPELPRRGKASTTPSPVSPCW